MGITGLTPSAPALIAGALFDAVFGDPRYAFHPVRLMGRTLSFNERLLRRSGVSGYGGGCLLFLLLTLTWVVLPCAVVAFVFSIRPIFAITIHVALVYSMLAMRDLIDHIRAVGEAADREDVAGARTAIARIVGRDVSMMDIPACRRAAIESLSENFVDGFLSPVFWYVLLGLPGLLLFKVVSTMDSMVGYKTETYLRFGWCGARLDDLMNYIPARLAWILLGVSAWPFGGLSPTKGWRVGLRQHQIIPGPNPGWSEATMAGLLQRKIIGPIWKEGRKVTEIWIGDPSDREAGDSRDLKLAVQVSVAAACLTVLTGAGFLAVISHVL